MLRLPGIAGWTEPSHPNKQKTRQMHDPGKPHVNLPLRAHEAEIVVLDEVRRRRPLARPPANPAHPRLAWYDRVE
jgi:hypothetical protein